MDSSIYIAAFAMALAAGYALLWNDDSDPITKEERQTMMRVSDEIKDGISNSHHKAEIDFWINEIAVFRKEHARHESTKYICQRLYSHALNQCARLQLTTFSL